jgi:DNA-binding CsgD family transcriptional regulator
MMAAAEFVTASDGVQARRVLHELIAALPPGPDRARALLRLVWIGADADAMAADPALVDQAREEAGDDDAVLAQIHLTIADRWLSSGIRAVRADAERAAFHAERSGDPSLRARCLVEVAFHRFSLGEGVQRGALAKAAAFERDAGLAFSSMSANTMLGLQLALSSRFDEAREVLTRELAHTADTGNSDLESFVRMIATELEVRAGRLAAADEHAVRMLELSVGSEITNYESSARWGRGLVDVHLGRVADARENLRRSLEFAGDIGDRIFAVNASRTLGLLELSCGDADAAARALAPLPTEEAALDIGEPMIFQLDGDVAEACVLTGDLSEAAAAQARLERYPDRPWATGAARRARGLIRGAEGRHEEAIADHRAALRAFAAAGQPLEVARTLLALGTAQRRAKQRGAARETLQTALAAFTDLQAALWAERAEAEIARLGGRRAADRDELTETERRIAELAAEGRANKEIAAALFVSERTVESNLTRAYRKLGVRSRTELARRLPVA